MEKPRIPPEEAHRIASLHATSLLGTGPEEAFDRITRLTARLLMVPMAVISLVGKDTQWFKSRTGTDLQQTPRDVSFCGHAILTDEPLVVPDAAIDPRFSDNPLVVGGPGIRFYAGVQLHSVDRMKLGTLCIMDHKPRTLSGEELEDLRELAHLVEQQIYHRQLAQAAQALQQELEAGPAGMNLPAAGQVAYLLNHDMLTGLANRPALVRAIQNGIAGWRERGEHAIVACINLDRFKRLNELLGHRAGDEALVAITRSLQDNLRDGDMLARAGSDEFIVLLGDVADNPGNSADNSAGEDTRARALLERLLNAVNRQIISGGNEIALTCSIGYARYPDNGEDADALLTSAALAMRYAKSLGGGAIHQFSNALRREQGRRLTLESHLRRAAEHNELYLTYQPKICLRSSGIAGFEALVCWQHPEYGLIRPDEFIPIAEETGLIVAIGEWALRTAVSQLAAWREEGLPPIPVAVNLSARQFLQTDVVTLVDELLRASTVEPRTLELELTESVSMTDPGASASIMRRLRELGVTLSIDDFGTGYSSFSYLKRLPIDKLKIDKSFITDMTQSAESLAIVQAIVAMAHRLHLVVVAEGVETADQVAALRKAECDQIQGYYYSRALRAADTAAYIRTQGAAPAPAAREHKDAAAA
ncbi:sensor domain-containing phosphodiesterase [Massilia sp. ST3]|uniref:sensor domain-containing phosphodiesterase n=1 Tax=Massilia sp. ST3 TaxID=2824903 RepID=UPI001B817664|nr:sensor domain-containing phosphodiesterase [Massilia sp. ST3]MBQ5946691.1 sensor domain-containing phosphodiesterase [Massilia sp. ST3]